MIEYVGSFGVTRYVGAGEGRDVKYDSSAKPAEGMRNFIEVVVDENGPVANVGTGFGNGQAYIPAGAVVTAAYLLTEVKGSAANVTLSLVKKDGTDSKALLAAATPTGDNSVNAAAGAAIGTRMAEDRYVISGGTKTGLKAKAVIEFI